MSSHHESIIREPLITGTNITYNKITEDVCAPVERMPSKAWWMGFTVAVLGLRLGLGYHQLRMVGRYWSRRNFDFCDLITFPSELEKLN